MAEVISDKTRLRQLASYNRKISNATTEETLQQTISTVSSVEDKSNLYFRQETIPIMSMLMMDSHDVGMSVADSGFGRWGAMRQIADEVVKNLTVIHGGGRPTELARWAWKSLYRLKEHASQALVEHVNICRLYTFRGIDALDAETGQG
ncbi:hypothetical protein F5Y16DRAFT_399849 [Xylariaceae sp. FL0255]|nr:hypothetical protein F5Y16DRAFT_399849 [Xylariaceae sp. FL0255]